MFNYIVCEWSETTCWAMVGKLKPKKKTVEVLSTNCNPIFSDSGSVSVGINAQPNKRTN